MGLLFTIKTNDGRYLQAANLGNQSAKAVPLVQAPTTISPEMVWHFKGVPGFADRFTIQTLDGYFLSALGAADPMPAGQALTTTTLPNSSTPQVWIRHDSASGAPGTYNFTPLGGGGFYLGYVTSGAPSGYLAKQQSTPGNQEDLTITPILLATLSP